jgi:DNA invertase Pin-like site-specific DNA recombinase
MVKAFAYLRTSSATNVGSDKDSARRQRAAIDAYALANGVEIVGEFYDAAVSGADPVATRAGFAGMLEKIAGNGVRRIVVETASRFARDLIVAETGFKMLQERGIELIAADSPESFADDTPTSVMIRQVLASVSEFEKAMVVAKLRGARDRKSLAAGKRIEGRKGHKVHNPALVEAARQARADLGDKASYQTIADRMNASGFTNGAGKALQAMTVKRLLA